MKFKYTNGCDIPSYVIEALRYIGKVGVMSKENWHEIFCENKNRRWKYRQLKHIKDLGFIKPHLSNSVSHKWVLDEKGKVILEKLKSPCVFPVSAHLLDHDEFVGRSLLILERKRLIQSWMVERELKMVNQEEFKLSGMDGEIKYPDAIFKMIVAGKIKNVAIEYERNGKSYSRYRSILWNYAKLSNISLVLFICEDKEIEMRIEKANASLQLPELYERIGITSEKEWRIDPSLASIKMNNMTFNFNGVCKTFDI